MRSRSLGKGWECKVASEGGLSFNACSAKDIYCWPVPTIFEGARNIACVHFCMVGDVRLAGDFR